MSYLIFDPIDFRGGSKVAVEAIFEALPENNKHVIVITKDAKSWNSSIYTKCSYWLPSGLALKMHGIPYLLKHVLLCLNILFILIRNPGVRTLVATSGPGIDLALYFAKQICSGIKELQLIQLVQGPVAESNISANYLALSDKIFYLPTALQNLDVLQAKRGVEKCVTDDPKFDVLHNGLASSVWPSPCEHGQIRALWAASNLKWKGLDLWVKTLMNLNLGSIQLESDICFINADQHGMPVSETGIEIPGVEWFEEPTNLDEIRSNSSVFISTSENEPFGLSILEALAAGMCVVIPSDGAYWDKRLTHGRNCIKYLPGDTVSLQQQLTALLKNTADIALLGLRGRFFAEKYRADKRYKNVHLQLTQEVNDAA